MQEELKVKYCTYNLAQYFTDSYSDGKRGRLYSPLLHGSQYSSYIIHYSTEILLQTFFFSFRSDHRHTEIILILHREYTAYTEHRPGRDNNALVLDKLTKNMSLLSRATYPSI